MSSIRSFIACGTVDCISTCFFEQPKAKAEMTTKTIIILMYLQRCDLVMIGGFRCDMDIFETVALLFESGNLF
jgi:hypothetical protein